MYILSVILFLLLGGFLLLAAMRFGVPSMVSDVYYQLQNCTGSEVIGDKRKRNYGWVFTAVMVTCAVLMMVCILDTGKGVQCLAFIGCVGWCLSACWVPTAILAFIYLLLINNADDDGECKPVLYMAEVAGFLDVFLTYWVIICV